MSAAAAQNAADAAGHHEPKAVVSLDEKQEDEHKEHYTGSVRTSTVSEDQAGDKPTEEDLATLSRVSGPIPWTAYTIAFVELCERFGYYGCAIIYVNFIQHPLPDGSNTGAGHSGQSGALDMGQRASFGLTTFNSFWAYTTPLLGAYVADEYLGRYKTIFWAIFLAICGHIILVISAIPPVIVHSKTAVGIFSVGLILLGLGTGCFKSNISPLIAEQYKETRLRVSVDPKTGERVIHDPNITLSRIFLYFYLMINVGSLTGQISMVYVEKYVGFWLAFMLPTVLFCFCPIVLFACRNKYHLTPPTGSILGKSVKLLAYATKGRWSMNPAKTRRNMRDESFWEDIKPSKLGANKPAWMDFDDAWVDQVARGFKACTVFAWIPLYWLAYNQMNNNLTSQAATMELNGVPNDVINNLNPLSLIIFIPLVDNFLYPGLRKLGIKFTPVKRIAFGFILASLAMVSATVVQYYIYKLGPCGNHANDCENIPAPINVWVQTLPYVLIGFSEIFTSITGLEYAFTKAPTNMRSLVTGVWHFQSAISSALGQALVSLAEDPLLIWNYGVVAVLAFLGGVGFWLSLKKVDAREDELNMLPDSTYIGKDRRHSSANV
ncbi:putative MFS peptide transporter [Patellaria atrata CBS 101060]|uniref:MFS peptide transporter n=1 Tax=Patellaria atrata CBS 101060 TaxID=1346257 RepID=A0A9P4VSP5_9PEZI|nr:putative MFS peptide transporter [Patellaria atrata CBS 101060]